MNGTASFNSPEQRLSLFNVETVDLAFFACDTVKYPGNVLIIKRKDYYNIRLPEISVVVCCTCANSRIQALF